MLVLSVVLLLPIIIGPTDDEPSDEEVDEEKDLEKLSLDLRFPPLGEDDGEDDDEEEEEDASSLLSNFIILAVVVGGVMANICYEWICVFLRL